jgi:hypothetical protein
MRSASRFLGAFVLLALGWMDAAQGTILCKTKDGTLKARDTASCPRNETRADLASLDLQGPPGPRGFRGLQGLQGIPGLPGPLANLHSEIRTSTFPIDYLQGAQTFKASCLPGEVVIGTFGTTLVGGAPATFLAGSHYELDGNVWSLVEEWPDVVLPNVDPPIILEPVKISLVCLSLQPGTP